MRRGFLCNYQNMDNKNSIDLWKEIMMSSQYKSLSARARLLLQYCLYLSDFKCEPFTLERKKWLVDFNIYNSDNGQFNKDIKDLQHIGFIEKVFSGKKDRTPNIYKLSEDWKEKCICKIQNDGYVYLVKLDKHYKIGISISPDSRLQEFTLLPYPLEDICIEKVNDYKQVEKELHKLYSDKRVRGEWFSLQQSDVENIIKYIQERKVTC